MSPQYLAGRSSSVSLSESFVTQARHFAVPRYVSPLRSDMIASGQCQVTDTSLKRQDARLSGDLSGTSNRRNRCRRTSRACWLCAWLPLWPLARSRKKKNSSLSIPRPSRWSRPTLASTSNTGAGLRTGRLTPLAVPSTRATLTGRAMMFLAKGRVPQC